MRRAFGDRDDLELEFEELGGEPKGRGGVEGKEARHTRIQPHTYTRVHKVNVITSHKRVVRYMMAHVRKIRAQVRVRR